MLLTHPLTMKTRQQDILSMWQALYDGRSIEQIAQQRNPRFIHTMTRNINGIVPTEAYKAWHTQFDALYIDAVIVPIDTLLDYHTFQIPKRTGGLRTICAPGPELKAMQKRIAREFQYIGNNLYPYVYLHDCAYAYIPGRDCLEAMRTHQLHGSKWFLKLDIKDFFPSCNREFLMATLQQIAPFCFMQPYMLATILNVCLKDDVLPQGSPASPLLSNLAMLPYDKAISDKLWNFEKHHFVYTRYADDIIISSKWDFNPAKIIAAVQDCLTGTPFVLKGEKTRYGSTSGRNWNLGLMLNRENKITIGHMKHKALRAAVHNFLRDGAQQNHWTPEDTQTLVGELGYLKHVETDAYLRIMQGRQNDFTAMVKYILNPNR